MVRRWRLGVITLKLAHREKLSFDERRRRFWMLRIGEHFLLLRPSGIPDGAPAPILRTTRPVPKPGRAPRAPRLAAPGAPSF